MPLDLSGFVRPEQKFEGLYHSADLLQRRNLQQQHLALTERARQDATGKFLTSYLDPKDYLTGTAYDPQIVNGFKGLLQQGEALASKGASSSDILMALGPQVSKLSEYSTKARLIDNQIKNSIGRLKPYAGYNTEAIETEAKKLAFQNDNGQLKEMSQVDPQTDWVSEVTKQHPELVTSSKGLDDFVAKTPMQEGTKNITTTYAGRSKNVQYKAEYPFWMDLQKDEKGNPKLDANGNPVGLGVLSSPINGDDGKPMVNPETGEPYQGLDRGVFNSIMRHNPDIADYIRGQVNTHFKAAGAKDLPLEGSPQWNAMAQSVLGEELSHRNKSHFNVIEAQKETGLAAKIEIGGDKDMLDRLANTEAALKLKGDYAYLDPKTGKVHKTNAVQSIGEIFNNNPAFLQGPSVDLPGGGTGIDVTSAFPGGGLKSGRGEDEVYKTIIYNPAKRTLLAQLQAKQKDANGEKPITTEEIPESKMGLFMSRIAAANGVDPNRLNDIFNQYGYRSAKFNNAQSLPDVSQRMAQEHTERMATVDKAIQEGKYDQLKGHQTSDGTIVDVSERNLTSWIPGRDKYGVTIKKPDGTTKTVTFNDKNKMTEYIKGTKPESNPSKTGASGLTWQ